MFKSPRFSKKAFLLGSACQSIPLENITHSHYWKQNSNSTFTNFFFFWSYPEDALVKGFRRSNREGQREIQKLPPMVSASQQLELLFWPGLILKAKWKVARHIMMNHHNTSHMHTAHQGFQHTVSFILDMIHRG